MITYTCDKCGASSKEEAEYRNCLIGGIKYILCREHAEEFLKIVNRLDKGVLKAQVEWFKESNKEERQ